MSSSISMKDIVCIMIIVILLVTLYYYFNNKFKVLFVRTNDLNDRILSQKNLINEQSQMLSALNHETQMLKNFAKNTNEKFVPSSAVDNKNFNPKEYNLDTEISKELQELLNSEEEEVADINEFEDEKNSTSSFISCREFKGHRKGWIFKKGEKGTGYYLDKVNIEEEKPTIEEEKPMIEEEKHKVEEEKPMIEKEKSKVEEEKPMSEKEKSKDEEEKPMSEKEKSKAEEEKHKVEEKKSKIKDEKPTIEEETTKAGEEKPKTMKENKKKKKKNDIIEVDSSKPTDISSNSNSDMERID